MCLSTALSALIELQPATFAEAVTSSVSITCCPDGTSARARKILVMEIAKDGNTPITNIQAPDVISYGDDTGAPHFQVCRFITLEVILAVVMHLL